MVARKKPEPKRKPAKKTTGQSTKPQPVLIPRPDGRGALNSGGTPGNKGGTGRPRDVIREAYLQGAELALPKLLAHLESDKEDVVQGASEKFLKYGLGSLKGVLADTVVEKVRETLDVVRANTTPEQYQTIAGQLRPIWS